MGAADGRHLDDLPVEQLDAVVLVQDAQLGQPVVGVHREGAREQANRHLHNMDSAKCASQFASGARAECHHFTVERGRKTRAMDWRTQWIGYRFRAARPQVQGWAIFASRSTWVAADPSLARVRAAAVEEGVVVSLAPTQSESVSS